MICVVKRICVIRKFGHNIRICGVDMIMFYFFCEFTFHLLAVCNGQKDCLKLKKTSLFNLFIFLLK